MEDSLAMNGGDGPNSYAKNSKFQEEGSAGAKLLLSTSIQEKLELQNISQVFSIADLGCSVGPNTFSCVETIVEAVQLKFRARGGLESKVPEFQVFFNDHVTNDFNTLFKGLPLDRQYTAAGVPGSFHGRLFPKASVNFMHSSFALHWLTKVPEEVTKEDSPAWNKGRVTYVRSSSEVVKAFASQFSSDMEAFFSARSIELATGGLMAVLMPCRPEGTHPSESPVQAMECLGDVLADMAKEGLVNEALVDSFNLPLFFPTPSEVKEVVSRNKHLDIETIHEIHYPIQLSGPEYGRFGSNHARAITEGILCKHFGSSIIDELFERYCQKLEEFSKSPRFTHVEKMQNLFLFVKRNGVC